MGIGTSIVLLIDAVVVATIVVLWDRNRRKSDTGRLRHPANPSPIEIALVPADGGERGGRWRITRRPGLPVIEVDILTYRPAGSTADWTSAPIVEPIVLEPGGTIVLPWPAPDPAETYDVVIAWTLRHPSGDAQGSRMVRVGDAPDVGPDAAPAPMADDATAVWVPVVWGLAAILSIGAAAIAIRALVGDGDDGSVATATTASTVRAPTGPATTNVATTPPASDDRETTGPTSPTRPTTAPSTTTTPATTAPPSAPPTSIPATTTSIPDDPSLPRVDIVPRIGECRYGDDCLIAGFRIVGFTPPPDQYVCEFSDASRFVFRFDGDGADDACASSGPDASITIEVSGVRSATVTRADVEPDEAG